MTNLKSTECPCGINKLDCDYHKPDQPKPRKTCNCYLYENQVCDICQGPYEDNTGQVDYLVREMFKTLAEIADADAAQPKTVIYYTPSFAQVNGHWMEMMQDTAKHMVHLIGVSGMHYTCTFEWEPYVIKVDK